MVHDIISVVAVFVEGIQLCVFRSIIVVRDISEDIDKSRIFESSEETGDTHPVVELLVAEGAFHSGLHPVGHDVCLPYPCEIPVRSGIFALPFSQIKACASLGSRH